MAGRVADGLREAPALSVLPRGLFLGDQALLNANGGEGAWCLPAFMAGLRSIAARPALTAEEVLDLGMRLGALRMETAALEAFRDHLWAGGFSGFELVVAPSLVEVATTLAVVARANTGTGAVRAFSAFSEDGVPMKAHEIDAAALEDEFDVEVDPLGEARRSRSLEPSAQDFESARAALSAPGPWASSWLSVPLDVRTTREAFPARRAAARIAALAEAPIPLAVLERLMAWIDSTDPWAMSSWASASGAALGELLAMNLVLEDGPLMECAHRLLTGALDDTTRGALVAGLLRRASSADVASERLLGRFVAHGRGNDLLAALDGARVDDAIWGVVARLLREAPVLDEVLLTRWATIVPIPSLVSEAPSMGIPARLGARARTLFAALDEPRRAALGMVWLDSPAGVAELGSLLEEGGGAVLPGKVLYRLLGESLRSDVGAARVLKLCDDRRAPDAVRVVALDIACSRVDLQERALASKMSHLLDSETVRRHRSSLREARAKRERSR
jgi:hypothetical protein